VPGKRLAQRRWVGERAALYLLNPVKGLDERCVHVNPEKVKDGVFPAGNAVADWMTDLHQ
jgi:hypothetical protein